MVSALLVSPFTGDNSLSLIFLELLTDAWVSPSIFTRNAKQITHQGSDCL